MTDSQQKHDVVAADAQAALPSSSTVVTPAIEDTQPVASTSALPSTTASQGDIIAAPSAKQPAVRVYRPPADESGPRIRKSPQSDMTFDDDAEDVCVRSGPSRLLLPAVSE